MATDLTNINISDSYKGLIHANGASLPAPSIQQPLYDGSGQKSSLSIGVEGVGASISGPLSVSGQLSAGAFTYPASPVTDGYVLTQVNSTTLALTSVSNILRTVPRVADGTYNNVQSITVANGLITAVLTGTNVRTFFCDLETFSATALSAVIGQSPSATRGTYPYGTSSATNLLNPLNVKPLLIRNSYLNKVWGSTNNNSNTTPIYGIPTTGDVAIVIFSDPFNPTITGLSTPQMFGIKYVWNNTNWIWERYLASSGPTVGNTATYDATIKWKRTFQVNNQFSTGGDGQSFGVLATYTDTGAITTAPVQVK